MYIISHTLSWQTVWHLWFIFIKKKKKLSHDYVKDGRRMTNNPKYIHSVTMEGQILSFFLNSFPSQKNQPPPPSLSPSSSLPTTKNKKSKTKNFCHIISMFVCNKSKGKKVQFLM